MSKTIKWDERYNTDLYIFGTEPNEFLLSVAGSLPVGDTLCLAEGEGRNGVYLAGLGHRVVAIDGSAVGLAKAKQLAAERGVSLETVVADLADYQIEPNRWDAIISIFAHVPPEVRRPLHRQLVKGLRPGGRFVLEAYTPEQLHYRTGGPRTADRLARLADLKTELDGLVFEHAEELVRQVDEGHMHRGQAAVVQLLAKKPSSRSDA